MISSAVNIAQDLTPNKEKPLWPLSSYAPSKHEPLLLAGLDESPEELRVKAFTALKAGNINEYVSQATISSYDSVLTLSSFQSFNTSRARYQKQNSLLR